MIPLRFAQEATYQLEHAGEHMRLAQTLASVPIFFSLFDSDDRSDYLAAWQSLVAQGQEPKEFCLKSVEGLRWRKSRLLPEALLKFQSLFELRGAYDDAMILLEEVLDLSLRSGDKQREMSAELAIGSIDRRRSNYESAMKRFNISLEIAESLSDQKGIANAIGSIGLIHMYQGRFAEAILCFERQRSIAEAIEDKGKMFAANNNIGVIHSLQGRYLEALQYYERNFGIAKSRGDKAGMSSAISNMGSCYFHLGQYDKVMDCFQLSLSLCKSLGDQDGTSSTLSNIGGMHWTQGRYAQAMSYYDQALTLEESLGDKSGVAMIMAKMGNVYLDLGQYDESLKKYREATARNQEIGDPNAQIFYSWGLIQSLVEIASLPHTPVEEGSNLLQEAREKAEECLAVSQRLSKRSGLFAMPLFLARIDAIEGNSLLALKRLNALRQQHLDDEQRSTVHYWLWKIDKTEIRRKEALRQLESLWDRTPKFEFRRLIADLRGEPIPMTADDLLDDEHD